MLIEIPNLLSAEQAACMRNELAAADWVDGRVTAGYQAAKVKRNAQLPEAHPLAKQFGDAILGCLERNSLFVSAALPLKVYPPMFNRYDGGQAFGTHVDTAIRSIPNTPHRVRSDLSATVFLTPPEDYDGGELVIEDAYGAHAVKLPAGHMVLYPAGSLHDVRPVTRGTRFGSFFWIQSMVRDDGARTVLFDLDTAIQAPGGRCTGSWIDGGADRSLSQPAAALGGDLRHGAGSAAPRASVDWPADCPAGGVAGGNRRCPGASRSGSGSASNVGAARNPSAPSCMAAQAWGGVGSRASRYIAPQESGTVARVEIATDGKPSRSVRIDPATLADLGRRSTRWRRVRLDSLLARAIPGGRLWRSQLLVAGAGLGCWQC